jgi:hypothetical protein
VSERRRNTRESGEKDDWEAVVRGDSREGTRERDGWAHRGTLSLQETIPSRGLPSTVSVVSEGIGVGDSRRQQYLL